MMLKVKGIYAVSVMARRPLNPRACGHINPVDCAWLECPQNGYNQLHIIRAFDLPEAIEKAKAWAEKTFSVHEYYFDRRIIVQDALLGDRWKGGIPDEEPSPGVKAQVEEAQRQLAERMQLAKAGDIVPLMRRPGIAH
jgi:hypothetical protein